MESGRDASGQGNAEDVKGEDDGVLLRPMGAPACGGGAAKPATRSGRRRNAAEGGVRLEQHGSKWTAGDEEEFAGYELVKHRCQCRTCPTCGKRRGWETRQVLLGKLELFRKPVLMSLTIDQAGTKTGKGFRSPEDSWRFVTERGYIRRLMGRLGIGVWVWVLEFHKSGWPHWHILADVSEVGRVDLVQAWHLWRDTWKLGGLDLQAKKRFQDATHAVMYITKYLTKPAESYPEWFLAGCGRRMCQGSQRVGRLTRGRAVTDEKDGDEVERREGRPLIDRMAECGEASLVVGRYVNRRTGEERKDCLATVNVSRDELVGLGQSGHVLAETRIVCEEVPEMGYTRLRVVVACPPGRAGVWVEAVERWRVQTGQDKARAERIRERRRKFLGIVVDIEECQGVSRAP